MSDQQETRRGSRPIKLRLVSRTGEGRRHGRRPALEILEGRQLLSYGGSPDFSFGTDGLVPYTTPANTTDFFPEASVAQPDGKIVVVGELDIFPPGQSAMTGAGTIHFAAARFNTDGTLDTSFGTHGYFTDEALSSSYSDASPVIPEIANAVALQSNGDLVVAGENGSTAVALRLTSAGVLDTTFGTGGIVSLGSGSTDDTQLEQASSVALLSNGQVAVGGTIDPTANTPVPAVELLNSDGSITSGFGTNGLAVVPLPSGASSFDSTRYTDQPSAGIVAESGDQIVLVANAVPTTGDKINEIVVTQFDAAGTLDTGFGTGGQTVITGPSILSSVTTVGASAVALQPNGDLVIGGGTSFGNGASSHTQDTVLRLDNAGTLDPTFGVGGVDILTAEDRVNYGGTTVGALALETNGEIVLSDQSSPVFSRLDPNGLPDDSFGAGGTALVPVPDSLRYDGAVGVSVLANGNIVGAFGVDVGSGLVELLGQGAEGDFGETGISDPALLLTNQSVFVDQVLGGTSEMTQFGTAGAGSTLPAPGAYNGGGVDELAVYLPGPGEFAIRPYNGGPDEIVPFGMPGFKSIPAPGDYDGSGRTELAVYLPSLNEFIYRPAKGGADVVVPVPAFSGPAVPAPGDYFGTGQDDIAFYDPQEGGYFIKNPVSGVSNLFPFGTPGNGASIPVPGDYDGSGVDELAVYLPASGDLIYRPAGGAADVTIPIGIPGVAQSIPAIGDYDDSGRDEAAVYEPETGTFTYQPANGSPVMSEQFGPTGGVALPFSLGTDSVAEEGLGGSFSPGVAAVSPAAFPLTSDVLDTLSGTLAKKKLSSA